MLYILRRLLYYLYLYDLYTSRRRPGRRTNLDDVIDDVYFDVATDRRCQLLGAAAWASSTRSH
jgi:hypothetical protein